MNSSGLYLYCIAAERPGSEPLAVSAPALDGSAVQVISTSGLLVVAHSCPAEPYQGSADAVRNWIFAHNNVVTDVWEQTGTVLPMAFDSIVSADGERDAELVLDQWVADHRDQLTTMLAELAGKVELGVRVFYSDPVAAITERQPTPRGRDYFQSQLLKRREAADRQLRLDAEVNRIVEGLGLLADSIRVNAPGAGIQGEGEESGARELLSVSLLVDRDKVKDVGAFLDGVEEGGYRVRFTGPWPPYSFAGSLRLSDGGDD